MSRYAFLRTPKWIFGHVIVVVLLVGFVSAGFWQLRRLDQRRDFNARIEANLEEPAVPLDAVLPAGSTFADVTPQLNRHVTATGRYLADEEVIITGQASASARPGVWVVTPLELDDGAVVLVNRGWLPSSGQITEPVAAAKPPTGRVTVTGLISATQTGSGGQATERDAARQSSFLRIDVERIQRQFSQRLVPAFLQRTDQQPGDPGPQIPQTLPLPERSEGPHLSYAIQWFSFTLLTLVAYPILLRSVGRDRARKRAAESAAVDLPPGAFVDADGVIDLTEVDAAAHAPHTDPAEPT